MSETFRAFSDDTENLFCRLNDEEKSLLVPLPYRVGYWISQADLSGGDEADRLELATLECLITSYSQDMCKSEFMQLLMEETVKNKKNWTEWQKNIAKVPEECRRALALLAGRLDEKCQAGFRENLMEIALSVAGAYKEEGRHKNLIGVLASCCRSLSSRKSEKKDLEIIHSQNVSFRERAALKELVKILG